MPSNVFHYPVRLEGAAGEMEILCVFFNANCRLASVRRTAGCLSHLGLAKVKAGLLGALRGEVSTPVRHFG